MLLSEDNIKFILEGKADTYMDPYRTWISEEPIRKIFSKIWEKCDDRFYSKGDEANEVFRKSKGMILLYCPILALYIIVKREDARSVMDITDCRKINFELVNVGSYPVARNLAHKELFDWLSRNQRTTASYVPFYKRYKKSVKIRVSFTDFRVAAVFVKK